MECKAAGRVERRGTWVGERHADGCPVGAGDDYGEGYGALRELEHEIFQNLEFCEDYWRLLDDGLEHPASEVRRLIHLLQGPRRELGKLRKELETRPISWTEEQPILTMMENQHRRYPNQVLEVFGRLYCDGEQIGVLLESAWERLDDGKRHTNDEHRSLMIRLSEYQEVVESVFEVLSPSLQWHPLKCPACGDLFVNFDGHCECGYTDTRLFSRYIRASQSDCPRCEWMIGTASEWKCCNKECGYVDKERQLAMKKRQARTLAGLQGRG